MPIKWNGNNCDQSFFLLLLIASMPGACSIDRMLVRAFLPLIEGGVHALNQATDLKLAEDSIPTNLELLEGVPHSIIDVYSQLSAMHGSIDTVYISTFYY